MSFIADKQTLDDLNLLGKFKAQSIFSLFNKVKTAGGERLLETLFRSPMTDAAAINQRSQLFRFFQQKQLRFPFEREAFRIVENYLGAGTSGNSISAAAGMWRKKLMASLVRDEQYEQLKTALTATIEALRSVKEIVAVLDIELTQAVRTIFSDKRLSWLSQELPALSVTQMAAYDLLLRNTMRDDMERVLDCVYQLDVYIAVSDVARERQLTYAQALPAHEHLLEATALRHPAIDKAVANPISFNSNSNVVFLTGANMAGKSTFMKSFGIAVYCAHMGFPVAAGQMRFSVCDGLYSSINVADNLNMGYSHFYAEVLRVKQVAETVSQRKNMIVIFDELFKGTNVKDAYDATLAVTAAFARYRNSFFIISTHIIEVGEALRAETSNLQYRYLPTIMEGKVPKYTYTLTNGITTDRHGMIIIENEGVLELIGD